MNKNIAILLAGGEGKRLGGDVPKQLLPLADGRSVLQTCIDTFRACPAIDDIWVVMHSDWVSYVPSDMHVIAGGKERWESSYKAIQAVSRHYNDEVNVWIHDAARPFVSQAILQRVSEAMEAYDAVSVAVAVTDTIYQVQSSSGSSAARTGLTLQSVPLRSSLMRAQTPQVFRLSLIKEAYERAMENAEGINATDDAGIVHTYMPHTELVEGEEANRKITFRTDL